MKKIRVTLGGYTKKYFSSKLAAINYAREISTETASYANWTQRAEVITSHAVITFRDGKRAKVEKVKPGSDMSFYH